jgi:hypothetical protein
MKTALLRRLRAARDFGSGGAKDAGLVQAAYDELMQRPSTYNDRFTNGSKWAKMLAEEIDRYKGPISSAPEDDDDDDDKKNIYEGHWADIR